DHQWFFRFRFRMPGSRAPIQARPQGVPIAEAMGATEDDAWRSVIAGQAPEGGAGRATLLTVASGPDAAFRDRHRRPLLLFRSALAAWTEELPPDEERRRGDEAHDRDPCVQAQAGDVVRRIDPEQLLEEAPERVPRHVEGEQRRRPDPEPAPNPQQD